MYFTRSSTQNNYGLDLSYCLVSLGILQKETAFLERRLREEGFIFGLKRRREMNRRTKFPRRKRIGVVGASALLLLGGLSMGGQIAPLALAYGQADQPVSLLTIARDTTPT